MIDQEPPQADQYPRMFNFGHNTFQWTERKDQEPLCYSVQVSVRAILSEY